MCGAFTSQGANKGPGDHSIRSPYCRKMLRFRASSLRRPAEARIYTTEIGIEELTHHQEKLWKIHVLASVFIDLLKEPHVALVQCALVEVNTDGLQQSFALVQIEESRHVFVELHEDFAPLRHLLWGESRPLYRF